MPSTTIENVDLTPDPAFVMSPMTLTDTSLNLVTAIIDNITHGEADLSTLAEGSETKFNEVIAAVNAMKSGYDVDFNALEEKVQAIMYLESEAGNDSFVGMFTKLFTELNNRKEPVAFSKLITASTGGHVSVDLSSYNFKTLEEFEVLTGVVTDPTGKSLNVSFEKVSLTEGRLTIRDADRLLFAGNAESYYDAAVKGEITVTLMMVKTATAVTGDLKTANGADVHLGHNLADHITFTPDEAAGTYTVTVDGRMEGATVQVDTIYDENGIFTTVLGTQGIVDVNGTTSVASQLPADGYVRVLINGVETVLTVGNPTAL